MVEPARVSCCIVGCGRTFRRDEFPGEVMCGKHYRHDAELLRRLRRVRKRWTRLNTLARKIMRRQGGQVTAKQEQKLDRIWAKMQALHSGLWQKIKTTAQEKQDQGWWTRPRRGQYTCAPVPKSKLADPFEREFQRLKRVP